MVVWNFSHLAIQPSGHFFVKKFFFALLISTFFLSPLSRLALGADTLSDYDKKISDFEKQKVEYLQKLEELKQAKSSLKNEISFFDNQIGLTEAQIGETQARLDQAQSRLSDLEAEINVLGVEIERLQGSIEDMRDELATIAVRRYKQAKWGKLETFLSLNSLSDFFNRIKYLSALENKDQDIIDRLRGVKVETQQEKDVLDIKRAEVEQIKNQVEQEKINLEGYRASLNAQRTGKSELLRVTQNDESKYQTMLAKVEAEIAAIRNAVGNLDNLKFSRHVERGEVIGVQGSTGWSTGDHLHFAVYHPDYTFYEDMEDPLSYLSDGRFAWPIQAYCYEWAYACVDGHSMSQPYGVSDISRSMKWYPNDFHDAVDLFGPSGSLIYAAEAGNVAYGTDSAGGNYAMVKHSNGLVTMYWHLR